MKNLLIFSFLLLLSLSVVSCNKDQAAVKKLDGDWRATRLVLTINGAEAFSDVPTNNPVYTFESCKLKKEEWCGGMIQGVENSVPTLTPIFYKVSDDGETLVIDTDFNPITTTDRASCTIEELSKTSLVFEFSETVDGDSYHYRIECEKE